jgi:AraC-like DNA-binding protein
MVGAFSELAQIIDRHATGIGKSDTALNNLCIARYESPTPPKYGSQVPVYALVAQGEKSLAIGQDVFRYGVGDFVMVSIDLPVIAAVTKASPEVPMLALALTLRPEAIRRVLDRAPSVALTARPSLNLAAGVSKVPEPLLDATLRYMRLLDEPQDRTALADLIEQEILYRLLTSPFGSRLVQSAMIDSPSNRIALAVNWLRKNHVRPLKIEDLASHVGMSVSSLHHHFKAITSMSPMQYQKQLRLNEARRLMLVERQDAGAAGFAVGYASRSQFSLEYARCFGKSPARDIASLHGNKVPIAGSPTSSASEASASG